mmetsp:Transcript_3423/g.2406  ORF Transcript_3423/g.2406 Transcript_3423/m.2406 type:complete len:167 (-) Transcript_3423:715-1215(-)
MYIYTAEVREVSIVEVTLDFSEGFNIQMENSNDLVATATIQPMQSDTVAILRAFDETWANPCKVNVVKKSPSIEEQKAFIKGSLIQLEREVQKNEIFWKDFPQKVAPLSELKEKLFSQGMNANFIDIEFPPQDKSIQDPSKGPAFDRLIHWRRPKDFMEEDLNTGL